MMLSLLCLFLYRLLIVYMVGSYCLAIHFFLFDREMKQIMNENKTPMWKRAYLFLIFPSSMLIGLFQFFCKPPPAQ